MTSCKKGLAKTAAGMTWLLVALACLLIATAAFGQSKGKGGGKGSGGGGGGGGEPPANPAIAYSGARGALTVMNADGSNRTKLLSQAGATAPSWSSDGGRIAFITLSAEPWGLWVFDVSVVDGVPTAGVPTQLVDYVIDGGVSVLAAAWSPISNEIAFVSHMDVGGSEAGVIYVVSPFRVPGGPLPEPLHTAPPGTIIQDVAWRADASQIAFTAYNGSEDVLWILDLATGGLTDIVHGGGPSSSPFLAFGSVDWARTKDEIAMSFGNANGSYEPRIAIVDLSTGGLTTIAEGGSPAWSPDDKKLAFFLRSDHFRLKAYDFGTGVITDFPRKTEGHSVDWRRNP